MNLRRENRVSVRVREHEIKLIRAAATSERQRTAEWVRATLMRAASTHAAQTEGK